jgi:hypothetical protein
MLDNMAYKPYLTILLGIGEGSQITYGYVIYWYVPTLFTSYVSTIQTKCLCFSVVFYLTVFST